MKITFKNVKSSFPETYRRLTLLEFSYLNSRLARSYNLILCNYLLRFWIDKREK